MSKNLVLKAKELFLKVKLANKELSRIFTFFDAAGFDIRLVGGCVRDLLWGHKVSDFDFATNALPAQVILILKEQNIKYLTHGIEHGTIIFIINHIQYEITSLRRDLKCDGRHALVEFTNDFVEDASRRDITINAMSIDSEGNLYDYFNGLDDLKNKIIRFVGDPFERVVEDYLRILRCYRFYSYYGLMINNKSREACKINSKNIIALSKERIWQEFSKILISPKAVNTLKIMLEDNVLKIILGGFKKEQEKNFDWVSNVIKLCNNNKIQQRNIRNYFCLTYGSGISDALILSNKDKNYLKHFRKIFSISVDIYSNINLNLYLYGKDLVIEYLLLKSALTKQNKYIHLLADVNQMEVPIFPLESSDIIEKFKLCGEGLGKMIRVLKKIWLNSNCMLTREILLNEANEEFKKHYF